MSQDAGRSRTFSSRSPKPEPKLRGKDKRGAIQTNPQLAIQAAAVAANEASMTLQNLRGMPRAC